MRPDDHADAVVERVSTLRVAPDELLGVLRADMETDFKKQRAALWDIFIALDVSQHGRARRVAVSRILLAHDKHGPGVVKLMKDIWARAQSARKPTRFFCAAAIGELNARGW